MNRPPHRALALAAVLALALGLPPVAALAQGGAPSPEDALWSGDFGLPEFDGGIHAVVEFRDQLIAAGSFQQAGGVPAKHIARWDGERWSPLGEGLPDVLPFALLVANDRLYAGGQDRDWQDGVSSMVFEWDGERWRNLSSDLPDGSLECLGWWRGGLVAAVAEGFPGFPGGTLGLPEVRRLAGDRWERVGEIAGGRIEALLANEDTLYAGGRFGLGIGDVAVPVVLAFSGSRWDTVASCRSLNGNPYSIVYALALVGHDLVIGGCFSEIDGVPAACLVQRTGGMWTDLSGGMEAEGVAQIATLQPMTTGLLVGGYFTAIGGLATRSVARWTGSDWLGFGEELDWAGNAICEFRGRVVAAGYANQTGTPRPWTSVAEWDGANWDLLLGERERGAGLRSIPHEWGVEALEVLDGSLHVGGAFSLGDEPLSRAPTRGVARWNGAGWTPLGPPAFDGPVHALAWYDGAVVAAGSFTLPGGIRSIARWTGTAWEPLGGAVVGVVHALAVWDGELYAAGQFESAGGVPCRSIARWNGSRWSPVGPTTASDGYLLIEALEPFAGRLVAGGYFRRIAGVPVTSVAAWDGGEWSAMGVVQDFGLPGAIHALEVHDGALWAATEGPDLNGVLRWSGAMWEWMARADDYVRRLRSAGGDLFMAGRFRNLGSGPAEGIARWDGESWSPLGSGLHGAQRAIGRALTEFEGSLWVGGMFTLAGGRSSFHVARWDGLESSPGIAMRLDPARPNPFERTTSVRFTLPSGATGSVDVLDLTGRVIRTLRSPQGGWGPIEVAWNGRDDGGERVPAGIYFIRLRSSAGHRTARVAFVP